MIDSPYSLIIFDCDGTLADSEPAHNKALSEQLVEAGLIEYTPEICMDVFMGTALPAIKKLVEDKHGISLPDSFLTDAPRRVNGLLESHMTLEATTHPTLEKLAASGIKMAVGSNGQRDVVLEILKIAGFDEFFIADHVFTFENVARPKPAPDLYLYVCSQMGVDPGDALVIEDTVKGTMGGINAGIDVIGYTGLSHRVTQGDRLRVAGCKHIIARMDDLLKIVCPQ